MLKSTLYKVRRTEPTSYCISVEVTCDVKEVRVLGPIYICVQILHSVSMLSTELVYVAFHCTLTVHIQVQ